MEIWNLCIPREGFLFFEFGNVFIALILFHSLLEIFEISYRKFWSKSLAPKKSFLLSYCRWWRHFKWVAEGLWNRKETKSQKIYIAELVILVILKLQILITLIQWRVRIKKEKQYFELVMEAFKAGENGLFGVRFLTHFVSRRGDYRSGKRLNMRKVIPYIASQFRKDKIWLRRTKPSKRQYQIMLAVDDSSSMNDNHSKQVRNEQILETGYKQWTGWTFV